MKPAVLIILDGWGIAKPWRGNAITEATAPNFFGLAARYPAFSLQASGIAVGLPWSEPGNSEVGHLTIGSGRTVPQYLPRILEAIADGSFFANPALQQTARHAKAQSGRLHLAGLVSSGTVHAYLDHLMGLLELAKREGVPEVYLHIFTDGRDGPPHESQTLLPELEARLTTFGLGAIASIIGRTFAMDRNGRWDFTQKTCETITGQSALKAATLAEALRLIQTQAAGDADVPGIVLTDGQGRPRGALQPDDTLILFNFREDSMRQIAQALFAPDFSHFARSGHNAIHGATLTAYDPALPVSVAFPPPEVRATLAQTLSAAGKTQLHIAEQERFAHVTTFFNSWHTDPFPGETDIVVGADERVGERAAITDRIAAAIIDAIVTERYAVIIANFAAADIIAHTGDITGTIEAVGIIDEAVARISAAVLQRDGLLLVGADHGHAEELLHPRTNAVMTEHTSYPVRCIVVEKRFESQPPPIDRTKKIEGPDGVLTDIAPTLLAYLGIPKPAEMTGNPLLAF
ncbi:MAG: 2,3-bisphosphoglycerate-independent phosphoglycerate mutase [Patescibacteria group bacterium]|nr:2,3-bisphosphoglycerate-independent phosphoglycerate mutase [Patescibacteria group bacterium]